jgi:hypothetical protein
MTSPTLLPFDIQREILNKANIPIDSFLYFHKIIGLSPKKLTDIHKPPELVESLSLLCKHQVESFKLKKKLEKTTNLSCCLVHITRHFEKNLCSEIMINVDDRDSNEVKMAFRINMTDALKEEMWTIRKTIVNMHTGENTCDFFDDSDDDMF